MLYIHTVQLSVLSKAVEDVSETALWFSRCCTDVSVGDVRWWR